MLSLLRIIFIVITFSFMDVKFVFFSNSNFAKFEFYSKFRVSLFWLTVCLQYFLLLRLLHVAACCVHWQMLPVVVQIHNRTNQRGATQRELLELPARVCAVLCKLTMLTWFVCSVVDWRLFRICYQKVCHNCYWVLGRSWSRCTCSQPAGGFLSHPPAVGCHYFLLGLRSPSQPKNATILRLGDGVKYVK